MGFEYPWGFWLLLAIFPLLWLLRRSESLTRSVINAIKSDPPTRGYFVLRYILLSIFFVSLVIVVTSPYVEPRVTGDYLFLIDTSRSMQARNSCGEPTFFLRAKQLMHDILDGVPESRFGIVVFDRLAFPVTQITYNHTYLKEVIDESLSIGMAYQATRTDVANALSVVAKKKKSVPTIFGNVENIILISDGNLESDDWRQDINSAILDLNEVGIKVVTLGIGNSVETPIPIINSSGICRDQFIAVNGDIVRIPLRADILKVIASETQGKYYGETQIDELVSFVRNETLTSEVPDNLVFNREQRMNISWIFLILASLSFFGFLFLKSWPGKLK